MYSGQQPAPQAFFGLIMKYSRTKVVDESRQVMRETFNILVLSDVAVYTRGLIP